MMAVAISLLGVVDTSLAALQYHRCSIGEYQIIFAARIRNENAAGTDEIIMSSAILIDDIPKIIIMVVTVPPFSSSLSLTYPLS